MAKRKKMKRESGKTPKRKTRRRGSKTSKKASKRKAKEKVKKEVKKKLSKKELEKLKEGNVERCPVCGSTEIAWNREMNQKICLRCGAVIEEDLIDRGKEWPVFKPGENTNVRVGAPLTETMSDRGLGTSMKVNTKLTPSQSKAVRKMKYWITKVSTGTERNLKNALTELKRFADLLNLPTAAQEEAARIYRQAAERGLVRGRKASEVIAGALYAACRKYKIPRTLDEIAKVVEITKKEVGKTYRFLSRQLGIKILPTSAEEYIYRFADELKLSQKTLRKALDLLKKASKRNITSGKGPMGVAAAALYIASLIVGEKRTQREVADIAGVTEVTIRNRYKELLERLDDLPEIRKIKDQLLE